MASNRLPWAFLVYIVADDRRDHDHAEGRMLDRAAEAEIAAIAQAVDLARVHVAVQIDYTNKRGVHRALLKSTRSKDFDDFEEFDAKPRTFWRQVVDGARHTDVQTFRSEELNSTDPGALRDFLAWGRRECPAEQYAVMFWGHSNGPAGIFYDTEAGVAPADGALMSLARLRSALASAAQGEQWALALFRDCYVNTFETAFELQGVVRYVFASQSSIPIAGQWPYYSFFSAMQSGGSVEGVAMVLAAALTNYHQAEANRGPFVDVPLTLVDLDQLPAVEEPLARLVDRLDAVRDDARASTAVAELMDGARIGSNRSDDPGDPALVDVFTACSALRDAGPNAVRSSAADLIQAVWGNDFRGDELVARTDKLVTWHGSSRREFHGISAYYRQRDKRQRDRSTIAWRIDDHPDRYLELALNKKTGWARIALSPIGV